MTTTTDITSDPAQSTHRTEYGGTPQAMLWTGRVLSALVILFLLLDGVMKLIRPEPVVNTMAELGYGYDVIIPIGVVLLLSTLLYMLPTTAVLGAILLSGYLGGAVATHVRVGSPLATHTLFPVYLGIVLWLGMFLRDARMRALLPWTRQNNPHSTRRTA